MHCIRVNKAGNTLMADGTGALPRFDLHTLIPGQQARLHAEGRTVLFVPRGKITVQLKDADSDGGESTCPTSMDVGCTFLTILDGNDQTTLSNNGDNEVSFVVVGGTYKEL